MVENYYYARTAILSTRGKTIERPTRACAYSRIVEILGFARRGRWVV